MKILVTEDEHDIALQYRKVLEQRQHDVIITEDGEACLKVYQEAIKQAGSETDSKPPFDVVIIDVRIPKKDGNVVAREILRIQPNQRIMFASAYVKENLVDSLKELNQIIAVLQKPFRLSVLVDTIEDEESYAQLEKLNIKVREIKNLDPANRAVQSILEDLSKIQKPTVWYAVGDIILG